MNCAVPQVMGSHSKWGNDEGMPPKRVPIVSTGKSNWAVMNVAAIMAITVPGRWPSQPKCLLSIFQTMIVAKLAHDSASAVGLTVSAA